MKCIKSVKKTKNYDEGLILRLDDRDAELKVKDGYWVYIPKQEWKATLERKEVKSEDNKEKKNNKSNKKTKNN